jgi:predicted esterase
MSNSTPARLPSRTADDESACSTSDDFARRRSVTRTRPTSGRVSALQVARLLIVLTTLAAGSLTTCAAQAQSAAAPDRETLEQRLISISPNTIDGARTVQALLAMDPDAGLALLQDAWPKVESAETRLYLLNMLQEDPSVLDVLQLGVTDPSLVVQNRAFQALEMVSFENFAEDFGAYNAWRHRQEGRTLEETMRESCREYIQSVNRLDDAQRFPQLSVLQRIAYNLGASAHSVARRRAMLDSGLPDALAGWLKSPTTAWTAFAVIRNLKMDEAYLRKVIVPLTEPTVDANFRRQALGVLASPDNAWAAEMLLKMFVREYPDPDAENLGYALTQMGDPRALPTLIAMIETDKSPEGQRVLGNILNLMTGNTSGLMRDGAWWRSWWTKNGARFPAEVRALQIPQVVLRQRPAAPSAVQGPEQHQIAGDIKRTYWLVTPTAYVRSHQAAAGGPVPPAPPAANGLVKTVVTTARGSGGDSGPPGLLVVLPPDGNGANAALFWQEMEQKALQNRYLVAVAVAPKWSDTQPSVWLTADSVKQVKEAKFTTEKFVAEIVQDVAAGHTIRPGRVFLHGAAESGPAAYACSLDEMTPFKGFYILASAFKSAGLPPLARARGRRYLIQHSPDDKAAPFVMAAAAQKLLTEHGAAARLFPYKGSHGYVFADPAADPIGGAISWLDGSQK